MSKQIAANSQLGQTLIETLVAIFILVTALITATTLAYYSLKNNDNSSRQVTGTAIAREGIEGIKNLRDSNWQSTALTTCDAEIGAGQSCYKNWLGAGQLKLNPGDYAIDFNPTTNSWVLTGSPGSYQLNFDPNTGNYSTSGNPNPSGYFRKVNITYDTAAPYSAASPRLIVTATSWWTSRSCPFAAGDNASLAALPASCKIVLVSHLTNWKNY